MISPESCSSILWRSWDKKETAAEQLRLTGTDMLGFGLVDGVIPEPLGGTHWDYEQAATILKDTFLPVIKRTWAIDPATRIQQRIEEIR